MSKGEDEQQDVVMDGDENGGVGLSSKAKGKGKATDLSLAQAQSGADSADLLPW